MFITFYYSINSKRILKNLYKNKIFTYLLVFFYETSFNVVDVKIKKLV